MVPVEDHIPLVPAGAQGKAQGVVPLMEQGSHVEGLVLQGKVVAVVAGQQVLVPGLLAVYFRLVNAQAAGVQPGGDRLRPQGEVLGEQGLGLLVGKVRGDPLPLPGLALLGGLKPGGGGGPVPLVPPHGDAPAVAGAGLQGQGGLKPQGGDVLPPAAVVDGLPARRHGDLGGSLLFALRVLRHPREHRALYGQAQRLCYMVYPQVFQSHNCFLLSSGLFRLLPGLLPGPGQQLLYRHGGVFGHQHLGVGISQLQ